DTLCLHTLAAVLQQRDLARELAAGAAVPARREVPVQAAERLVQDLQVVKVEALVREGNVPGPVEGDRERPVVVIAAARQLDREHGLDGPALHPFEAGRAADPGAGQGVAEGLGGLMRAVRVWAVWAGRGDDPVRRPATRARPPDQRPPRADG